MADQPRSASSRPVDRLKLFSLFGKTEPTKKPKVKRSPKEPKAKTSKKSKKRSGPRKGQKKKGAAGKKRQISKK